MAYLLRPPVVRRGSLGPGRLGSFYTRAHGVSLLVTGSVVQAVETPSDDDVRAADAAYIGGHEYVITDAAAQPLIDAGYAEECLEPFDGYVDEYEESY